MCQRPARRGYIFLTHRTTVIGEVPSLGPAKHGPEPCELSHIIITQSASASIGVIIQKPILDSQRTWRAKECASICIDADHDDQQDYETSQDLRHAKQDQISLSSHLGEKEKERNACYCATDHLVVSPYRANSQ